ncbi:DUF1998 domain-containing protein [Actinomadura macra]|uniref:DUF1998 domain-containing protein n=1 Tax=Actinomadura macra TaxID=46164 RepID=UPI00082DF17B|nr:DUF1998 domain-containing protein [Actinomadura macra]
MTVQPLRVGELRPNQLLHTFGVGAVADLPNLSVVVGGLDDWDLGKSTVVREDRLLAAVRRELGDQVEALRTPPHIPETSDPFAEWSRVGVPVRLFPRWLRCTACNILAPVEGGLFKLLPHSYSPERIKYIHECRGRGGNRPIVVPARFVLACERGHLDDFPWMFYVHGGTVPQGGEHMLKLQERGTTGEAANVYVSCSCRTDQSSGMSMAPALGPEAWRRLPACRGRDPHLAAFSDCGERTRTLGLGATNSWFAMQLQAFTLPRADDELTQKVIENWKQLELLVPLPDEVAKGLLPQLTCWQDVESFGVDKVLQAVRRRASEAQDDDSTDERDLDTPEWEALTRPDPVTLPDFTIRKERVPQSARTWLSEVVLAPRLRRVSALYGFTRIDAPEWEVQATDLNRRVRLSREAPTWVPCAETRGEGILLRFDEDRIAAWERRPEVLERQRVLQLGHERWRAQRRMSPGDWPGMRYALLHTFAHVLIRQFALECGYNASGIAERIYARSGDRPMAGILLYTAAPDSEGTFGGLVSLGRRDRLGDLIGQALDAARLCSSDPLCAQHDPRPHGRLFGAACHACLFAAETSCEHGNHYLDRALLVDTVTDSDIGFLTR